MLSAQERAGPCLVPSNRTLHYRNTGIMTDPCSALTQGTKTRSPLDTPRQHARVSPRRWSKPPTTPRAATPSHPHSARAAAARTPMPTGGNPAMQASTRPRPHPACAGTAHTPMHATRDRPTRAHACRRSSGGVRPPGTAHPRAQEHGTPMPCHGSRSCRFFSDLFRVFRVFGRLGRLWFSISQLS